MHRGSLALIPLWVFGAVALADSTPPMDSGLTEEARSRIHRVRIRIQRTWEAPLGTCTRMSEQDLKIGLREQRVALENIELDRTGRPTLHALIIDTSSSMTGHLHSVREAAAEYVGKLDERYELALVATFDDTLQLVQGVTSNRRTLIDAIRGIRAGGTSTSLNDGLHYMIRELGAHRERPVIVLLSDGADSSSIHLREDIFELIDRRPDLTVFPVGIQVPSIDARGMAGASTSRRYLQRLAQRTRGKFFDARVDSRIDNMYRRVRDLIDNEAVLTVVDPYPELDPGELRVRSRVDGCKIVVLPDLQAEREPDPTPYADALPASLSIEPERRYLAEYVNEAHHRIASDCEEGSPAGDARPWLARVELGRIRGCALDMTLDVGVLYDPMGATDDLTSMNQWMFLETRSFDIPLSSPGVLPTEPAALMDDLARFAVADAELVYDPRRDPSLHALPHGGHPRLVHGRMFFDLRFRLAEGMYLQNGYREWVEGRLREESRRDLEILERSYRQRVPDASEEALALAVMQSDEGRRVLRRPEHPSRSDLTRYLAAWLGDTRAHDLFVDWERLKIDAFLAGDEADRDGATFSEEWEAIRQVFFAPSYTRVLTLLSPVHDASEDRIGYWRVLLPRPGWLEIRRKGYKRRPEYSNLPLDLIPERPLAHWLVTRLEQTRPGLLDHVRRQGYHVASIEYELLSPPSEQVPMDAFDETRVILRLTADRGSQLTLTADLSRSDESDLLLDDLRCTATGDDVELRRLSSTRDGQVGTTLRASRHP